MIGIWRMRYSVLLYLSGFFLYSLHAAATFQNNFRVCRRFWSKSHGRVCRRAPPLGVRLGFGLLPAFRGQDTGGGKVLFEKSLLSSTKTNCDKTATANPAWSTNIQPSVVLKICWGSIMEVYSWFSENVTVCSRVWFSAMKQPILNRSKGAWRRPFIFYADMVGFFGAAHLTPRRNRFVCSNSKNKKSWRLFPEVPSQHSAWQHQKLLWNR